MSGSAATTPPHAGTLSPIPMWLVGGLLVCMGLLPLSNLVTPLVPVPWWKVAIWPWLFWSAPVCGSALLFAALGRRADVILERANRWILSPSPRAFSISIFLIASVLAAMLAWFSFQGRMLAGDEFSLRFQANLLLHGRLTAVPERYTEFFSTAETLDWSGRWFSQFPIGGAAVLVPGAAVHAAWLVNPLFAGWIVVSMYRFVRAVDDEVAARWTSLLLALTAFLLFLGATQLNHTPALAFIMWGISALPTWATSSEPRAVRRSAVIIGLAFACAATIRPYDAALCAGAVGVFQLVVARGSSHRWSSLPWQFLGGLIPLAILLVVNARTTGSPLLFGYDALNGPGHRPGFHLDPRGIEHTPARGLYLASSYLMRMNVSLFESPLPALLFVTLGMFIPRRAMSWDYLLGAIIVLVVAGYGAYWADGFYLFGPRFLYTAVPAFVWFAARGQRAVARAVPYAFLRRAIPLVIPICIVLAWALPYHDRRIFGVQSTVTIMRHEHVYRPPADPIADVRTAGLKNALVFVRESWRTSLEARMRGLGMPPLATEAFVVRVDTCSLELALDELPDDASGGEALTTVVDRLGVISRTHADGPQCQTERALDTHFGVSLAILLPEQDFTPDGHVGGNIVWARDLGPKNRLLRERFGDRSWYRYQVIGDHEGRFVPIEK